MAIINRLSRLFQADFHAVLDNLEEPEILLRHSIREMQESLEQAELQAQFLCDEISSSQTQLSEINESMNKLNQELEVCFESAEENLAKNIIRRKLELQKLENYLQTRIERDQSEWHRQTQLLNTRRNTLASLQHKSDLFIKPKHRSGSSRALSDELKTFSVTQDDVDVAFLGEQKRRATT